MIQIRWKKLSKKIGVWLTTEILLNLMGLDNFADYSEFVFAQDLELSKKDDQPIKFIDFPREFCHKIKEYCPISGTVFELPTLPAKDFKSQTIVLQQKCQKLRHRCVKTLCLSDSISSLNIACSDND